jgi:serine-type D-Ala-D-Ala carboxypeptidase (penicillin-binding protein 5/6)
VREFPGEIKSEQYPAFRYSINSNISAKAIVIMDKDSKVVLFSKNPNLLFSMASTTKIMTAITALDYFKMNDVLTVKKEKVEGVNVGFTTGEKLFFKDILYAMLLPSGNDAALAIAQNYPGGENAFIQKMNEKAKSFHLVNTNFADSIGLEDSRDYTTPLDLAQLTSIALENKTFAKIVATKTWEITDIAGVNKYSLANLNQLLGIQGVNGVKTGYTTEAGQVLITSKKEGEHTLIIVVMDSLDRFSDTSILLNQISGNINYLSIHP